MPNKNKNPLLIILEPADAKAKIVLSALLPGLKALKLDFKTVSQLQHEAHPDMVLLLERQPQILKQIFRKQCVPIALKNGSIEKDYNPVEEEGNGFYFEHLDPWEIFASLVRARETFQFPYDWENLLGEIQKSQ